MYIQTPKRYARKGGRRRHNLISWRKLLFWITMPLLIFVMIGIYENRERWIPDINRAVEGVIDQAGQSIATANAPVPTATADPTNDLRRANEAWRRGAIQEAVLLYERASASTPNNIEVHFFLTLGLIMQGRFDEAAQAAERAITASPFSPDAWSIRSMALNRLGRNEEAAASALRALELVPSEDVTDNSALARSRARAQAFLAEAFLNLGQGQRASTLVEQALETYPDSFEAYQIRGRINQEVNADIEAALADYRTAYDLAPNLVYLGIWVARLERVVGNPQAALELFQDMSELNPGNTQLLLELGDYYRLVDGNYSEALGYLNRCVEADPQNANCHYQAGRVQYLLEEFLAARESFQRAIDLDPEYGYPYYWYADASYRLGQCAAAIPYIQTGQRIADETKDTILIDSIEAIAVTCGLIAAPQDEVTPEAESGEVEDAGSEV